MEESADGEGGGTKPPSVVPRYLTVGDHVLAFSEHELEDTGDYEEPEKVKAGHVEDSSPSPNYEKPEDVLGCIELEGEESPPSNDYETPEDVHGYKDEGFYENPENIYGYKVFKAKDRNECTKNPCEHGRCENKDNGYKCTCSPGWTGQNCQQDINECTRNPCKHGRCVNKDGGYKCTCSPGWTGQNCQQDINECTRNPCQHGRCVNKDGGYKCTCSPGWTGQNCQQALTCKGGWSEYKNHCYRFFSNKASWHKANENCKQLGANLASATSPGENKFITGLIAGAPSVYSRHVVWFGLNCLEGPWKWSDGSPFIYDNWAPGEPGRNFQTMFLGRKAVKCANMYSKDDKGFVTKWILRATGKKGMWNDHLCREALSYVCEMPK
ncbi:PREDICTED: neurocan core protein-like [Branchiostoma belcheri]|uniref:Neurocan core protein-like n=1 Tax=Branchiostoma belcheri TaxID=7741 RepID=A0A6P5A3F2_BRABE|nr:PREDICTED: neurocan core protein-like [Branchiostoma belcheri]